MCHHNNHPSANNAPNNGRTLSKQTRIRLLPSGKEKHLLAPTISWRTGYQQRHGARQLAGTVLRSILLGSLERDERPAAVDGSQQCVVHRHSFSLIRATMTSNWEPLHIRWRVAWETDLESLVKSHQVILTTIWLYTNCHYLTLYNVDKINSFLGTL